MLEAAPRGSTAIWERDRAPGRGGSSDVMRYRRLLRVRAVCETGRAPLVVGGRPDLAVAVGAEGVQLPERGLRAALLRATFPDLWVGRSCHDRAGLERAQHEGTDWASLSPVRAPSSKAPSEPQLRMDGFGRAIDGLTLPVVALGGVDGAVAGPLFGVGARAVATLAAVLERSDAVDRALALLGGPDPPL